MSFSKDYYLSATAAGNAKLGTTVSSLMTLLKREGVVSCAASVAQEPGRNRAKARAFFAIIKLMGGTLPKLDAATLDEVNADAKNLDKRQLRSVLVAQSKADKSFYLMHTTAFKLVQGEVPDNVADVVEKFGYNICFDVTEEIGRQLAPLLTDRKCLSVVNGDVAYVRIGEKCNLKLNVAAAKPASKPASKTTSKPASRSSKVNTDKPAAPAGRAKIAAAKPQAVKVTGPSDGDAAKATALLKQHGAITYAAADLRDPKSSNFNVKAALYALFSGKVSVTLGSDAKELASGISPQVKEAAAKLNVTCKRVGTKLQYTLA